MAIKKLQNNYTMPEQSQRLLDLGVPVKSADCYYMIISGKIDNQIEVICNLDALYDNFEYLKDYFPCWSVGRLIEIFDICNLYELHKFSTRDWSVNIKKLMQDYEVAAEENMLDFSKLEE